MNFSIMVKEPQPVHTKLWQNTAMSIWISVIPRAMERIQASIDHSMTQSKWADCAGKYNSKHILLPLSTENKIFLELSAYWNRENQYIFHPDSYRSFAGLFQ